MGRGQGWHRGITSAACRFVHVGRIFAPFWLLPRSPVGAPTWYPLEALSVRGQTRLPLLMPSKLPNITERIQFIEVSITTLQVELEDAQGEHKDALEKLIKHAQCVLMKLRVLP